MLLQLSQSPLFNSLHPAHPLPPSFSTFSSCPWVVHISSLASLFHILFLTSPCLFYAAILLLIPCTFSPILPHLPADNPPCDLHFCDSVPVLVVCLVCFCLCLGSVVNSNIPVSVLHFLACPSQSNKMSPILPSILCKSVKEKRCLFSSKVRKYFPEVVQNILSHLTGQK